MIPTLYEALTGRPWTTGRSLNEDFGPPPAVVYAEQLAGLTDTELLALDVSRVPRRAATGTPTPTR
ncbi:hypothetical protein [Polymorphospora sp. NPDC050346]|uniref:hypothetical protein n=1 Tax=Polymorphospora sp. NPDC050346 TaxID=3155780 RepID=UPI0033D14E70